MGNAHAMTLRSAAALFACLLSATTAVAAPPPLVQGNGGLPTLAPLMEKVTPAVVNISVLSQSPVEDNPLFRDPFFRRFFSLPQEMQPQMSAGSGVIVDAARGYILTNFHVIQNATEIKVTLKDRRQVKAMLIGSDRGTDIALLKINAANLTALPFGDSDNLRVGDFVVAIGNPFGLGQTVTSGIVSALGRSGLDIEGYEDFIQTDASINPGNSGGALVDLKGELIGINTAIISPAGANAGIGFAVPSNMARAVMEQLARYGEVRRGRLGINVQDLTPELAHGLGVARTEGAVITQVQPDSPAARAGLRPGDIVIEADGHPVRSASDLRNRIALVRAGQEIELTLLRSGARRVITARVGERQTAAARVAPQILSGAILQDIRPGMPMYGKVEGVLVASVKPDSAAAGYGVRAGDVIVQANGQRVKSVTELHAALRDSKEGVTLAILRGNEQVIVVVR
jgi:Do/DeqQ family serine protease